jgi:hypothetical protein
MKYKLILCMILAVFVLSSFALPQEQTNQTIELPKETLEYKVERGVINSLSWIFAGIAYAKTKGDTPEDFARYGQTLWGSYWEDLDIKGFVQKWHRVFSPDFHFKMEILKATENSVETRMTIFARRCAKTFDASGVTEEEYVRFICACISSTAEYLGWHYEQKLEEDWLYFTISKRD